MRDIYLLIAGLSFLTLLVIKMIAQKKREVKTYDEYIISSILANNEFGIEAVNNVDHILSTNLVRSDYEKIAELIRNREFETIKTYQPTGKKTTEFLTVTKFTDQNERDFIVTSYDSDKVSQYPQVIDIIAI